MHRILMHQRRQEIVEWKSFKDEPPVSDCMCWVKNEKGWMFGAIARYDKHYNVFINQGFDYHDSLTLDVTHWIELPEYMCPLLKKYCIY